MGLANVLLLCWTWIRLIMKYTMSMTRSLLLLSCLKSDLCSRVKFKTSGSGSTSATASLLDLVDSDSERPRTLSPSTQSFIKDYVKNNLKSVTTQIINNGQSSTDVCKVEQGPQKAKYSKKKFTKRANRRSGNLSADYHEISEETPKDGLAQKMQRPPRPNYFVAVQVTDSKVLENAKRIQDGILQNSRTDLSHMKVDIRKSHITLMAMHLADSVSLNSAKECLDQTLPGVSKETSSGSITLEFEGLSVFSGGSVLFITAKPSPALQSLILIADIITKGMKQRGIIGAGNEFKPHMTLMKYRRKKQTQNLAKKVERTAYKKFEKEYLGSHTISSIQLCRMEGVREDGYYIVEHEVFLQT